MNATTKQLVMAHNNGFDTVLLIDGDKIVSEWQADRKVVVDYLRDGSEPDNWDVQTPDGIEIDGNPATVEDYGEIVGTNGTISDERRDFWVR